MRIRTGLAVALLASAAVAGPALARDRLVTQVGADPAQIAWGLIPPGDLAIKVRYECKQPGVKTQRGGATVVVGNDLTVRTGPQVGPLVDVRAERDFNRFRLYAISDGGFSCRVTTTY